MSFIVFSPLGYPFTTIEGTTEREALANLRAEWGVVRLPRGLQFIEVRR